MRRIARACLIVGVWVLLSSVAAPQLHAQDASAGNRSAPTPAPPPPPAVQPLTPPPPIQSGQSSGALPVDRPTGLVLDISQGRLVGLNGQATNVFIADPNVADVQIASPDRLFVFGKKAGRTTLYALGADGQIIKSMTVDVRNQTAKSQQMVTANPGTPDIRVTPTDNGVVMQGTAATPAAAALAAKSMADFAGDKDKVDDRVKVKSSAQVTLRVRIAEVDRTITKELGFNWNALVKNGTAMYGLYTGRTLFTNGLFNPAAAVSGSNQVGSLIFGNNDVNAVIDALAQEDLVTILAEPNLTAISGEPASFLVGGEFPVPISQASTSGSTTITVEFKQYGIQLNFVPTVMADNHISLRVKPEVSQLTTTGEVNIGGLVIPALLVRRAETTIELGSGQSFAIAGLLQNNTTADVTRYPGLGDLPVLGALFRSSTFQRNETELVIIVTPYIVKPIDDPKSIRLPTDSWQSATDVERILNGKVASPRVLPPGSVAPPPSPHLLGDAGFEVE